MDDAAEHAHWLALKGLLETLDIGIDAVNEPRRIVCRAPNFVVSTKGTERATVGYIEAKDVGADLGAIERDSDRRSPAIRDAGKRDPTRDAPTGVAALGITGVAPPDRPSQPTAVRIGRRRGRRCGGRSGS